MSDRTIAEALAATEPTQPRALGSLLHRLDAAGLVRGARVAGRPAPPADVAAIAARGPTDDSRTVGPGSIFVALVGDHVDGHDYLDAAAAAGAAIAIVEHPVPDAGIAQVVVADSRRALAAAACWWSDDPSHELGVIGITGTDGKTTTGFLLTSALEAAGIQTGLVGTVDLRVGGVQEPTPEHVTTPGAPVLQALLRAMVSGGDRAAVVETTSHGLALHRVDGIAYDVAIFTNLSHEHLELHGSFEAYRAAKLSLFERLAAERVFKSLPDGRPWPRVGIVDRDDPSAPWFMAATTAAGADLLTYGTDPAAEVRASRVEEDRRVLRIGYLAPSGPGTVELRLAGRFNVHNALAVLATGEALGLDPEAVRSGLASVERIPGRMERIDLGQPFEVVVDYAHTPASLTTVLDLLAPGTAARGGGLVVVFGSAGERDRAKRPLMGRVAGDRGRLVIVTDEDPRAEDREVILDEIAAGAEAAGRRRGVDLLLIADRRTAIETALEAARPGDTVVLAGKGHERTILYADHAMPWDEASVAATALRGLGFGA